MKQKKTSPVLAVSIATALIAVGAAMAGTWLQGRGHAEDPPLSIDESIRLAAGYLITATRDDGSFVYEYHPINNTITDGYNILRHAGTTYALLEAYAYQANPEALAAARRAIGYLQTTFAACPQHPEYYCVVEGGEIKLGGNALAVLALVEHARVTGDLAHIADAKKLAGYLLSVQSAEGEFTAHKINAGDGSLTAFTSEYYPGEALFALSRLGEVTRERVWMDAAHRGARWIIETRDSGKLIEDLPHDHWLLYALNELDADRHDPMYVAHARRLTDAIVADQHQNLVGAYEAWNGGYYTPPRSTPTATRSEGLLAAYQIFMRAQDHHYAAVAETAAGKGIAFSLRTQMTPGRVQRLGAHPEAIGGFSESLDEYTIRNDYVQHNLSAMIAYQRVGKGK